MNALKEILELTARFINRPDLIQGPGGNTSVKDNKGRMFIKASGFRFEELNEHSGVSCVTYNEIRRYFYEVQPTDLASEEKKMLEIIGRNILSDEQGKPYPRPSMETGFHAVLDKYVVHTHSVWTNLVNCASDRSAKIKSLSEALNTEIVEIPFVTPGFGLSYLVTSALKNAGPVKPKLFLLANHGVIAHSDSADETATILHDLDRAIAHLFVIDHDYPDTAITGSASDWQPASDFVFNGIKKHHAEEAFFERVLFPDQTVFFKGNMSFDAQTPNKINISSSGLSYHCEEREARSIHETMTAYLFIFDTLNQQGVEPEFIGDKAIEYINSMDMEKHRKSLFKEK